LGAGHTTGADQIVWATAAVSADHPVIRGITTPWARDSEEWYNLARSPTTVGFSMLGTRASNQGPVVWAKEIGTKGRSVCTTLGQGPTTYTDENFKKLVLQSILWAANRMQ
jgi:type 1 glutamine amidotransferase